MIVDGILLVLQGFLQILLAPLTIINIGIDFFGSIPVVVSFLECVIYLLPWDNLLPLILLIIALFGFRIAMSIARFIRSMI